MAPTATTGTDSTRHIFPFFNMARELRDEVYDACLEEQEAAISIDLAYSSIDLALMASNMPTTQLKLISRRFRQEYQERSNERSDLRLQEIMSMQVVGLRRDCLPAQLTHIRAVRLDLLGFSSFHYGDGVLRCAYRDWTTALFKHLPKLQSLSIRINLLEHHLPSVELMHAELTKGRWAELPFLKGLCVYVGIPGNFCDFNRHDGLVLQLSKDTGKIEMVKEAEQNMKKAQEESQLERALW
ncbi:hypothetical protein CLAFUW4_08044 [Fulvia fulva]|uniref:Uncharacterized protein n=1 Tax=Passalora fulva TaxID=5499 RepID=A0A9Q8LDV8_PASFU|nr:uncharacterized protein CLAFUR5_08162 [Fulvia fulva]KAK4628805.1 hypothetical protein CLAFUR4_08049 [Fulvia fulva]KAK4629954.1 hypothetical protein CLAFUR0_08044 [Fulvia fulva]UJO15611.1 hypothetical protein CLAFUR5_08162 [Fulvia fulva]WPV12357.1 hypothetical protein CLAFUW4_08044 [Fulvia fulva]WPV27531.1 hypothetical protein CLAFUW7_08044 [Fulvia fulva]